MFDVRLMSKVVTVRSWPLTSTKSLELHGNFAEMRPPRFLAYMLQLAITSFVM